MTTIAMVQVGATLPAAIIMAATLAATAPVSATSPPSSDDRHCFRATTAAGAGEAMLTAVDSMAEYAGGKRKLTIDDGELAGIDEANSA